MAQAGFTDLPPELRGLILMGYLDVDSNMLTINSLTGDALQRNEKKRDELVKKFASTPQGMRQLEENMVVLRRQYKNRYDWALPETVATGAWNIWCRSGSGRFIIFIDLGGNWFLHDVDTNTTKAILEAGTMVIAISYSGQRVAYHYLNPASVYILRPATMKVEGPPEIYKLEVGYAGETLISWDSGLRTAQDGRLWDGVPENLEKREPASSATRVLARAYDGILRLWDTEGHLLHTWNEGLFGVDLLRVFDDNTAYVQIEQQLVHLNFNTMEKHDVGLELSEGHYTDVSDDGVFTLVEMKNPEMLLYKHDEEVRNFTLDTYGHAILAKGYCYYTHLPTRELRRVKLV